MMRQHLGGQDAHLPGDDGERSVFCGELYRRHAPRLLAYLCHHLPTLPDAEDALLDVFLSVLENEASLRTLSEERQNAWIWTVARNKMLDYHRRQQRKPRVSLQAINDIEDEARTPEQAFLRWEADEQLRRWIHRLSPLQQEVLLLRFAGELRCSEIAVVLQKRAGAVRGLLTRALHTLRGVYTE